MKKIRNLRHSGASNAKKVHRIDFILSTKTVKAPVHVLLSIRDMVASNLGNVFALFK